MSDPRQPETAALIRAIKAAERLGGRTDRACTDAAYAPAVERLEDALAAAERAAGVSTAGLAWPGPRARLIPRNCRSGSSPATSERFHHD